MTEKFGRIHFHSEQGYSCCGQLVIYDLTVGPVIQSPWDRVKPTVFESQWEQFDEFRTRLVQLLEDEASDWNREKYEDDPSLDRTYGFMTMTLIKGPTPQIPGLIEFLLGEGWQCDHEVRNPKTGNIIVHLSKAL